MKSKIQQTKYIDLPATLKPLAMQKAVRIGYKEIEAVRLFFNVQDGSLRDGVINKGFKF